MANVNATKQFTIGYLFIDGKPLKFDSAKLIVQDEGREWSVKVEAKKLDKMTFDFARIINCKDPVIEHSMVAGLYDPVYEAAYGKVVLQGYTTVAVLDKEDLEIQLDFENSGKLNLWPEKGVEDGHKAKTEAVTEVVAETKFEPKFEFKSAPKSAAKSAPKPISKPISKPAEPLGRYPMHDPLSWYRAFRVNLHSEDIRNSDASLVEFHTDRAGTAAYNAILKETADAREAILVTVLLMRSIGMNVLQLMGRTNDPKTNKPITYRGANYAMNINEALGTTYKGSWREIADSVEKYLQTKALRMPVFTRVAPLLIAISDVVISELVKALKEDLTLKEENADE